MTWYSFWRQKITAVVIKKNFVNNLADYISEIDTNMASKRLITRYMRKLSLWNQMLMSFKIVYSFSFKFSLSSFVV